MKQILLVEPSFPFSSKSRNQATIIHKNFVPIGLLKLAAMHSERGDQVQLIRGNAPLDEVKFLPDIIYVTTLFTYWSSFVWDSVKHYRQLFPKTKIILGGVYATLHADKHEYKQLEKEWKVTTHVGLHLGAEKFLPKYDLIPDIGYHATHMMRGCFRRCKFCGTWKIEPEQFFKSKDEIVNEIKAVGKTKVIFYDNNLLANPNINEILFAFVDLRINGKLVEFESQSGFDGRLMTSERAQLLKKARFKTPRIAWDGSFDEYLKVGKQIEMLLEAGYRRKEIYIFMIYNFNYSFQEMEKKRSMCWNWKIQIADCRYRPLDQTVDAFNARKIQNKSDYYIHAPIWTDSTIKLFRKNVRRQNICVRHGFSFYSRLLENMQLSKERSMELRSASKAYIKSIAPDAWFPDNRVSGSLDFNVQAPSIQ